MFLAYLILLAVGGTAWGFTALRRKSVLKKANKLARVAKEVATSYKHDKDKGNLSLAENERRRIEVGNLAQRELDAIKSHDKWESRVGGTKRHLNGFLQYGSPLVTLYGVLEYFGFANPAKAIEWLNVVVVAVVELWKMIPGVSA